MLTSKEKAELTLIARDLEAAEKIANAKDGRTSISILALGPVLVALSRARKLLET